MRFNILQEVYVRKCSFFSLIFNITLEFIGVVQIKRIIMPQSQIHV